MPAPVYHTPPGGEAERLPASYANFLIANAAVLLPVFDDPNDAVAIATMQRLFPGPPHRADPGASPRLGPRRLPLPQPARPSPMTVDLRSDTVTRPTQAMRAAMASAEVGDDVYREDPTARRLEETVAEILGKEDAVFVPSGVMGNQIAIRVHTRAGDEVIVAERSHIYHYEAAAPAALWGVQLRPVGDMTGDPDGR